MAKPTAPKHPKRKKVQSGFAETYDDWSELYQYLYADPETAIAEARAAFAAALADLPKGARVLDVGCGVGFTSAALMDLGYKVAGIDLSSKSIKRAEALCRGRNGEQPSFVASDVMTLAADHGYDAVVAMASLIGHVANREAQESLLGAFVGQLRLGGRLVLSSHDYQNLLDREPDDAVSSVTTLAHADGSQSLTFQRRQWQGRPRERLHLCTYFMIRNGTALHQVSLPALATPLSEITEVLAGRGLTDIIWLYPEATGYYQPICVGVLRAAAELVPERAPKRLLAYRARKADTRPIRTLLAWSGGPASTYALLKTLHETTDDVMLLHVLASDRADRRPNDKSLGGHGSAKTLGLLQEIRTKSRPFEIATSIIGPDRLSEITDSANVVAYFAAQAAMSWELTRFDRILFGSLIRPGSALSARPGNPYQDRLFLARQMVKTIMRSEDAPEVAAYSPRHHSTAVQAYLQDHLGADIAARVVAESELLAGHSL